MTLLASLQSIRSEPSLTAITGEDYQSIAGLMLSIQHEPAAADYLSFFDLNQDGHYRIGDFISLYRQLGVQRFGTLHNILQHHGVSLLNTLPPYDLQLAALAVCQWPRMPPEVCDVAPLVQYRPILLELIQLKPQIFECIPEFARMDPELALAAATSWERIPMSLPLDLLTDPQFVQRLANLNLDLLLDLPWLLNLPAEVQSHMWPVVLDAMAAHGMVFPLTPSMQASLGGFWQGMQDLGFTQFPERFQSLRTVHTLWQNRL